MARNKTISLTGSESSDAFRERLRTIAEVKGGNAALARAAGIAQSTIQLYLKDGEPTRPVLVALAKASGRSVEWLVNGAEPASIGSEFVGIPTMCPVDNAGNSPITMERRAPWGFFRREWLVKHLLVEPESLAAVRVPDDGLPATLHPSDWVLIDHTDRTVREGLYYIIFGQTVAIRLTTGYPENGMLRFVGGKGHPAEINVPQIDLGTKVRLVGRVIWAGRFFGGNVLDRSIF